MGGPSAAALTRAAAAAVGEDDPVPQQREAVDAVLGRFSEPTRAWFAEAFEAPTAAQVGAWEAVSAGRNTLVVAPTGSG